MTPRKIFTIGYSDNTYSSYILNYLTRKGVIIDGVIFPKNNIKGNWKRLITKFKMRGSFSVIRRIFGNIGVRKSQISQICQQHVDKVFFVDNINSEKTKEILISHGVELVLLTSAIIIEPIIINIDGLTILNAHTGWLPRFRGLDANLKALRDGHKPGVSVHKVIEKIDGGEIYLRESFNINYHGDILKQLDYKELHLSAKLLTKAVLLKSQNVLNPIAIDEPLGKYEPLLDKKTRNRIIKDVKDL